MKFGQGLGYRRYSPFVRCEDGVLDGAPEACPSLGCRDIAHVFDVRQRVFSWAPEVG